MKKRVYNKAQTAGYTRTRRADYSRKYLKEPAQF